MLVLLCSHGTGARGSSTAWSRRRGRRPGTMDGGGQTALFVGDALGEMWCAEAVPQVALAGNSGYALLQLGWVRDSEPMGAAWGAWRRIAVAPRPSSSSAWGRRCCSGSTSTSAGARCSRMLPPLASAFVSSQFFAHCVTGRSFYEPSAAQLSANRLGSPMPKVRPKGMRPVRSSTVTFSLRRLCHVEGCNLLLKSEAATSCFDWARAGFIWTPSALLGM